MDRRYSPSALRCFASNCPSALGYYWKDREEMKAADYTAVKNEFAAFGSVFHYIVYQCALAKKKNNFSEKFFDDVVIGLSTKYPPEIVHDAAEHAKEFVSYWEFPKQFDYEHGMAFDKDWHRVEYDSALSRFRLIVDAIGLIDYQDGENEYKVALGQDYKTGWACNQDEVESIQMDAYVTVLDELYRDKADGIAVEIVSTRLGRAFTKMYFYTNSKHVEEIVSRRKRLSDTIAAADLSDLSARVGFGCIQCDYAGRCPAFSDALKKSMTGMFPPTPEGMRNAAIAYITLTNRLKVATGCLKDYCKEHDPIIVDGNQIGYFAKDKRELKDGKSIIEVWFKATGLEIPKEALESLGTLFGIMSPGVTAWEKVVKKCAKDLGFKTQKAAVEEYSNQHVEVKKVSQFDWQKEKSEDA